MHSVFQLFTKATGLLMIGVVFSQHLSAQSTFSQVYNILQTNCSTGSSCHNSDGGNTPAGLLDFTLSETDLHAALLNGGPTNLSADSAGMKRIWPGDPRMSYLYRKINRGLESGYNLPNNHFGEVMPKDANPLPETERYLIHQWIMWGAPLTGTVVDSQTLADYTSGLAHADLPKPNAPAAWEGIQLHYGPIFVEPG